MKLAKLTLALSAVFALPAFAADLTIGVPAGNILYISGASAVTGTVKTIVEGACDTAAGGVFASYKDDTDGKQAFVYTCSKAKSGYGFAAGSKTIVVKRDKDGSFAGVGPVVNKEALDFPDLKNCSTTACAMGGTLGAAASVVPNAGLTDVDANIWKGLGLFTPSTTAFTTKAGFAFQGFGVAVSDNLYGALQVKQGLSGCAGNYTSAACQPSISKTEYASIVAKVGDFHQSWEPILGAAYNTEAVNLCRRVSTSGTQASSNVYFLENPCGKTTTNAGFLAPATAADSVAGKFIVTEGSSTGNVKTCLSNAATNADFAIGVISLENLPGSSDKWHFVKLDGVSPNINKDGTITKQKESVINGDYNFAFEMQALYRNDASTVLKGFVTGVTKDLADPAKSNLLGLGQVPGLKINSDAPAQVAKVTRNGNACQPFQHLYY